jgi:rRNA maturation endonuclease Nob1
LKALEYVMKNDPDEGAREAAFEAAAKIRSSRGILEEEPPQKVSVEGDLKYIHVGDKIGTQVKDSVVQRSTIGAGARKCSECGKEVEANEKFCPECGAKL